jgi:hypothetical protein
MAAAFFSAMPTEPSYRDHPTCCWPCSLHLPAINATSSLPEGISTIRRLNALLRIDIERYVVQLGEGPTIERIRECRGCLSWTPRRPRRIDLPASRHSTWPDDAQLPLGLQILLVDHPETYGSSYTDPAPAISPSPRLPHQEMHALVPGPGSSGVFQRHRPGEIGGEALPTLELEAHAGAR